MELLYIWIKHYKGIRDLGLNLSNEFRFQFDEENRKLVVAHVDNYIPHFFAENITNLTAVIGENGAGKTTALRYIVEYLSGGIHNHQDEQGLVVFKQGEKISYYSSSEIEVDISSQSRTISRVFDTNKIRSSAVTIFLSNIFDPTSYYTQDYLKGQLGETKNLSTQYLLFADYQNWTGEDAERKRLSYDDHFSAFAAQEMIRMVRLIRWLNNKEANGRPFPVQPPPYVNLVLRFNQNEKYGKELDLLSRAVEQYFGIRKNEKNRFLVRIFLASLYHFMNDIKFISGPEIIRETYEKVPSLIRSYLKENQGKRSFLKNSIVPEFHEIFYFVLRSEQSGLLNERIGQIQEFLHHLEQFLLNRNVHVLGNGNGLSVQLTRANKPGLELLIEEYYKVERISGYADFYFSHAPGSDTSLSSGEYALLLVFARLNSVKVDYKKPLIILIDEAELALHPQWQKEFIYHFVDFIQERFVSHKVQIVLTAHSPFILSDMPPNCVVLLEKNSEKRAVISNLKTKSETFGANIHELFADAFFLNGALMGHFAKEKIDGIIKSLQNPQPLENINYVQSVIQMIGEPIIKTKLAEMLAEKLGENMEAARLRIQQEYINKRLKELGNDTN